MEGERPIWNVRLVQWVFMGNSWAHVQCDTVLPFVPFRGLELHGYTKKPLTLEVDRVFWGKGQNCFVCLLQDDLLEKTCEYVESMYNAPDWRVKLGLSGRTGRDA